MSIATTLSEERVFLEQALHKALANAGTLPLYGMIRYFLGYEDERGNAVQVSAGKRMRPLLLLYVARMLGGLDRARELALAVELFHNFTLIHDDVEDNDALRRGRKTVWALWGVPHAINAGDALAYLANDQLLQAANHGEEGVRAAAYLNARFREVAEGQYRDFALAERHIEDTTGIIDDYLEMIRQKSAVLIGGSVAAGALAVGRDRATIDTLYAYGESLGMAYQIADDVASLWGEEVQTGKRAHGDLHERKKTYPVLWAIAHGAEAVACYYKKQSALALDDAKRLVAELTALGAFDATVALLERYRAQAEQALEAAQLPQELRETLRRVLNEMVVVPQQA